MNKHNLKVAAVFVGVVVIVAASIFTGCAGNPVKNQGITVKKEVAQVQKPVSQSVEMFNKATRRLTEVEIEARRTPITDFCEDIKKEFGSTLARNTYPHTIRVNITSPGGEGLTLGIVKSTSIRAPRVPMLSIPMIICSGNGGYFIIDKVERNRGGFTMTQRTGRADSISGMSAADDLATLVGLPGDSIVVVAFPLMD